MDLGPIAGIITRKSKLGIIHATHGLGHIHNRGVLISRHLPKPRQNREILIGFRSTGIADAARPVARQAESVQRPRGTGTGGTDEEAARTTVMPSAEKGAEQMTGVQCTGGRVLHPLHQSGSFVRWEGVVAGRRWEEFGQGGH
jgi:hypothetical protein